MCWTRNDRNHRLVNSGTAEVIAVEDAGVTFRLEDGRTLDMHREDPQLRHIDRAWASTVHAFQGRTVDRVIAAMEADHAHLTTQKTFYVEISRARHHAELVTDDRNALREHLEAATGERIAALEAIMPERGNAVETDVSKAVERDPDPLPPESHEPALHGEPGRPERTRAPVERTPETVPVPQPEKRPRERERIIEGPELELEL